MSRASQGSEAELIVLAYERLRLGRKFSDELKYVGDRPGYGFDIQSVNSQEDLSPRFIEVKSLSKSGHIFLTGREKSNLKALGASAWLYIVNVCERRIVKAIQNPIDIFKAENSALTIKIKV